MRGLYTEVGSKEVHADICRAFTEVIWCQLGCFGRDGITGVSEGSKRCKNAEKMGENVADGVAETAFVGMGTGENMVTVGVEVFTARAFCTNKGRGECRKAEAAKKGKTVGVVVEALVLVLAGETV